MTEEEIELRRIELAQDLCRAPTIVGASDVLARASFRPAWLVPEMIPLGDLTLMTGRPGAMKSWLAYALAVSVAQGGQWFDRPTARVPRPRRGVGNEAKRCEVVVLNYDNSTAECGRRFARLGLRANDPVVFHSLDVGARLRLPDSAESLAVICDHLQPSLVLIDSLRQAHTAEENSSKEMMAIMDQLKRLYACGAAVLVVHHSGKGAAGVSKSRGSEEIDASATAVIHVDDDRGTPTAQWVKHRSWPLSAEDEKPKHFRVTDVADSTIVIPTAAPQRERKNG